MSDTCRTLNKWWHHDCPRGSQFKAVEEDRKGVGDGAESYCCQQAL